VIKKENILLTKVRKQSKETIFLFIVISTLDL